VAEAGTLIVRRPGEKDTASAGAEEGAVLGLYPEKFNDLLWPWPEETRYVIISLLTKPRLKKKAAFAPTVRAARRGHLREGTTSCVRIRDGQPYLGRLTRKEFLAFSSLP